jgi:sulfate adenylyltransferase subunit 1 (EFTu-like GTPase family)
MLNDIALIKIDTKEDLYVESYPDNKVLGRFVLVDKDTNNTVAAGMIA